MASAKSKFFSFWLFGRSAAGLSGGKRVLFHLWNWLLPLLKASESSQKPNFSFHDTETGLKQAVANVSATRTATYTMVLKTTKGQAELFEIVRSSLPSGSYGVSFNTRPWKLSGYKQLNLTITV